MYTSYIGKKFLEYYKEEYSKPQSYSAEQFFDEVMFPIFFDDERHLMSVKGSPFFQMNAIDGQRRKKELSKGNNNYQSVKKDPQFRLETKKKLDEKIQNKELGVHTFVGYGEMTPDAYTSGQITSIDFNFRTDEFYFSWIGQGLSIGASGLSVLIEDKSILLHTFEGWKFYREFLNQTPNLFENQISKWNGQWFRNEFGNGSEMYNFSRIDTENKDEFISIAQIQWTTLVLKLCHYSKNLNILANVYVIGDKNNLTFGFILLCLKEIYELYELRDMIFINEKDTVLSDNQIERLLPFYSFKQACMQGTIGLKSIEPRGLRNYLPKGTFDYSKGNDINIQKEDNFPIYKLWIIAMLNKKELLDLSREFAKLLKNSVEKKQTSEGRAKSTQQQFVKDIFDSKTSKQFVDNITNLVDNANSDILRKMAEETILMPRDNFPLFLTLIKFEYTILSKKGELI